jgi:single-strand DNA-binding protein
MKSFNHVVFVGHVGKEPVERLIKKEKEDVKVCQFSLAVDEGKDKEPLWLTIVAWRTLADQVKHFVHTGDLVLVEGKLHIRTYTDKANVERTAVEVIASDIRFLQAKQAKHETPLEHTTPAEQAVTAAA